MADLKKIISERKNHINQTRKQLRCNLAIFKAQRTTAPHKNRKNIDAVTKSCRPLKANTKSLTEAIHSNLTKYITDEAESVVSEVNKLEKASGACDPDAMVTAIDSICNPDIPEENNTAKDAISGLLELFQESSHQASGNSVNSTEEKQNKKQSKTPSSEGSDHEEQSNEQPAKTEKADDSWEDEEDDKILDSASSIL